MIAKVGILMILVALTGACGLDDKDTEKEGTFEHSEIGLLRGVSDSCGVSTSVAFTFPYLELAEQMKGRVNKNTAAKVSCDESSDQELVLIDNSGEKTCYDWGEGRFENELFLHLELQYSEEKGISENPYVGAIGTTLLDKVEKDAVKKLEAGIVYLEDRVWFNGSLVDGATSKQLKLLLPGIFSSEGKVFFRGELASDLDAESLETVGDSYFYYKDKNGYSYDGSLLTGTDPSATFSDLGSGYTRIADTVFFRDLPLAGVNAETFEVVGCNPIGLAVAMICSPQIVEVCTGKDGGDTYANGILQVTAESL